MSHQGKVKIFSGRMNEIDMLAATRKLEESYPSAIKLQVKKYNYKANAKA